MNASNCKYVISFLWTNAIVVGVVLFLVFSFIDPADIAISLNLDVEEGAFRVQVYSFSFLFLWAAFTASTCINCYYSRLKYNLSNTTAKE
ncbi:hypothetical protein MNBD_GAMMA07-2605 [hydrothermal vent metagenome]|uniref:Uncharacterized protein n=1 Tax=hydrothermal vent metagenome TaxID=652676 RepID=A0A3B0WJH1_9ZZZZ